MRARARRGSGRFNLNQQPIMKNINTDTRTKTLGVVPPDGGEVVDVAISPATTADDILRKLGLQGLWLSKVNGDGFLASRESLWPRVEDGEKLAATSPTEVAVVGPQWGPTPFSILRGRLVAAVRKLRAGKAAVPHAAPVAAARRLPRRVAVPVKPSARPYWQESGWRKHGKELRGTYQTRSGAWPGLVILNRPAPDFFVWDLPKKVTSGPHRFCFQSRGDRKWFVHFRNPPRDADSGIRAIEESVASVFERREQFRG